jgi:hypothetical protein
MESSKGLVVLIVFCVILAVAGVAFVAGGSGAPSPPQPAESVRAVDSAAKHPPATTVAEPSPAPKVPGAPVAIAPPPPLPEPAPDPETGNKPDPRLIVAPVAEPEIQVDGQWTPPAGFDIVASFPDRKGFLFEREDDSGRRIQGVAIPGLILVTRGLVELFGCGEGGKEHETVLRLESDVQSLDLALTSAGFNRGKLPEGGTIKDPNQGSRVIILVQWTDQNGKTVTHRSEDLVVSLRRNSPMPRVGWTYVAQWSEVPDPAQPKGERKQKVLMAANSRSYVTTFRDRTALLDNPLEEAVDDTLFAANFMLLPPSGTPVRVIFRTPTTAERQEIEGLEKEIAKQPKDFHADDRKEKDK